MKVNLISEPLLQFSKGQSVCPKEGITLHDVFGADKQARRKEILLGCIGTDQNNSDLQSWIEKSKKFISGKPDTNYPKLYLPFCGFNTQVGFKTDLILPTENERKINNSQITPLLKILSDNELIEKAVDLYIEQIKFLSDHRTLDVIICVIPDSLYSRLTNKNPLIDSKWLENNFRRALKAKAMVIGTKPLQLIREKSLKPTVIGQQDEATKAWNITTALYYKANQIGPWRLLTDLSDIKTCYVGISFYKSRDGHSLHTSLAQVFDDMGRSIILRGTPINLTKNDKIPHLSGDQSRNLLNKSINEFKIAMEFTPSRVVIHKSSLFNGDELEGFNLAANDLNVRSLDFVTIFPRHNTRLVRDGNYPPLRGTHLTIDEYRHFLYTRGTVEHYNTYPGPFIPIPLEIRIIQSDTSPDNICSEILALTKMDWNNTQFDKKLPITLECAHNVGEIMKYIGETDKPQGNYSYYM